MGWGRARKEDFTRRKRRWWQLTSMSGTVDEEARDLLVLGNELEHLGGRTRSIAKDMGYPLRSAPVDSVGRRLEALGRRWRSRGEAARADATRSHDQDLAWRAGHDRATREDWSITLIGFAASDLEQAQRVLHDDAETLAQLKRLTAELDAIYWHVHERDETRRRRRSQADGSDPRIPIE
jgi:hypothetical protein